MSSQRRLPLLDCCGYEKLAWTIVRDSRGGMRQYTAQPDSPATLACVREV